MVFCKMSSFYLLTLRLKYLDEINIDAGRTEITMMFETFCSSQEIN